MVNNVSVVYGVGKMRILKEITSVVCIVGTVVDIVGQRARYLPIHPPTIE